MANLVQNWLKSQGLTMAALARILKVAPCTVHGWCHGNSIPSGTAAWKLHKATNGLVPITEWGYVIVNGKIKKISDKPIRFDR